MVTDISIHAERCTGCKNCQLACSFVNTGVFDPSSANISIQSAEDTQAVSFLETCLGCGVCADFCVYGALEKVG